MVSLIFLVSGFIMVPLILLLSHPIMLCIILVWYSIIISMSSMTLMFSWTFYLLMLIFLGGVMILIGYISTLASNEKFEITNLKNIFMLPMIIFLLLPLFYFSQNGTIWQVKISNSMGFLYFPNNMMLTLFLFFYLLLTMICVVKLIKMEKSSLVKRL